MMSSSSAILIESREGAAMGSSVTAPRRSTRATYTPLNFTDIQAANVLSEAERRDLAAAVRLSLANSWSIAEKENDEDGEESESSSDDY
jgi:hypothetical protein